jgi:hypothetical protein
MRREATKRSPVSLASVRLATNGVLPTRRAGGRIHDRHRAGSRERHSPCRQLEGNEMVTGETFYAVTAGKRCSWRRGSGVSRLGHARRPEPWRAEVLAIDGQRSCSSAATASVTVVGANARRKGRILDRWGSVYPASRERTASALPMMSSTMSATGRTISMSGVSAAACLKQGYRTCVQIAGLAFGRARGGETSPRATRIVRRLDRGVGHPVPALPAASLSRHLSRSRTRTNAGSSATRNACCSTSAA